VQRYGKFLIAQWLNCSMAQLMRELININNMVFINLQMEHLQFSAQSKPSLRSHAFSAGLWQSPEPMQ
jgi:hypothetical protein